MRNTAKRRKIREAVMQAVQKGKVDLGDIIAISRKVSIQELFEEERVYANGWIITDLFDIKQGVTWGGYRCESIYVLEEKQASMLESEIVWKTIGGRNIKPWRIEWNGKYLLFPYVKRGKKWVRAFQSPKLGGVDVLDFSVILNPYEKGKSIEEILNFRIAQRLVPYPKAATYLVSHYEDLSKRIFEGKNLSEYGKSWYEYHRPRAPSIVTKPKIVGKRMMKEPSFAIDTVGYLPRDSVISLIPKSRFKELKKQLSKITKTKISNEQALKYVLFFLNSEIFSRLLSKRRSKKRGGYPIIDERLMRLFVVPFPSDKFAEDIKAIINRQTPKNNASKFYTSEISSQKGIMQY